LLATGAATAVIEDYFAGGGCKGGVVHSGDAAWPAGCVPGSLGGARQAGGAALSGGGGVTIRLLSHALQSTEGACVLHEVHTEHGADLQQALKTFSEKFDRDAPTLTESQRVARQKEGADLNRDLQRKQREYQEDLNGRRNEELQQVLEKANKAVRKVADDEKYDLVVQEVVYSNGRHDITDKVLKLLNTSGAK
jgi:outer membrane protein